MKNNRVTPKNLAKRPNLADFETRPGEQYANMKLTGNEEIRGKDMYIEVQCDCYTWHPVGTIYKYLPFFVRKTRLLSGRIKHCGHKDNHGFLCLQKGKPIPQHTADANKARAARQAARTKMEMEMLAKPPKPSPEERHGPGPNDSMEW